MWAVVGVLLGQPSKTRGLLNQLLDHSDWPHHAAMVAVLNEVALGFFWESSVFLTPASSRDVLDRLPYVERKDYVETPVQWEPRVSACLAPCSDGAHVFLSLAPLLWELLGSSALSQHTEEGPIPWPAFALASFGDRRVLFIKFPNAKDLADALVDNSLARFQLFPVAGAPNSLGRCSRMSKCRTSHTERGRLVTFRWPRSRRSMFHSLRSARMTCCQRAFMVRRGWSSGREE